MKLESILRVDLRRRAVIACDSGELPLPRALFGPNVRCVSIPLSSVICIWVTFESSDHISSLHFCCSLYIVTNLSRLQIIKTIPFGQARRLASF